MRDTVTPIDISETYLVSCDASQSSTKCAKGHRTASAGVAVIDARGSVIVARPILIGNWGPDTTLLELRALFLALQTAGELGIKHAELVNDNAQAVLKMDNYLKGPIASVPKNFRSHVEHMDSLTVRVTTPGEERLPHDLAQQAIVEHRAKKDSKKKQTQNVSVVKVSIPNDMLAVLDSRVRSVKAGGRSDYILDLVRRDLLGELTLQQILAPDADADRRGYV